MTEQRKVGMGFVAAVMGTFFAVDAALAEAPNRATLREMGLGSLVVMSDNEALEVRGAGGSLALAWGRSSARVGREYSRDNYFAVGEHFAAGGSFSHAGIVYRRSRGGPFGPIFGSTTRSVRAYAGGHSWAIAN